MAETARTLIDMALKEIGAIAVGETPTAAEEQDGLKKLQVMLRHWSAKNIRIHFITEESFAASGAESYTIGPTGVWVTTYRPVTITRVYLKDSVGNQTNINFAYNPLMTNGVIYISKEISETVYVESLKQLLEPTLITSNILLPDEYQEAIVYGLAIRFCPEYGKEPSPTIIGLAQGGLNDLETRNFAERIQPVAVDVIKLSKKYDINSCN